VSTLFSPSNWLNQKLGIQKGFFLDEEAETVQRVSSGDIAQFKLRRGLHQLARVVNIVQNAQLDGYERNLALRWSDGKAVNHPGTRYVSLNPVDFLHAANETQAIDRMTGQALMASSMKRTMDMNAFLDYLKTSQDKDSLPSEKAAKHLFEARESVRARDTVLKDWKGFRPYFDIHQETSGAANRVQIEEIAANPNQTPESFAAVSGWNVLFPGQKVSFNDHRLDHLLGIVESKIMEDPVPANNHFRHQVDVGQFIVDNLEVQPEDDPQGSGDGSSEPCEDSSGDGEGESGGHQGGSGDEGQEMPGPLPENFSLADPSLFGEQVEGHAPYASELDLNDDSLTKLLAENNVDYYPDSDHPLLSLGIARIKTEDRSNYSHLASTVRSLTEGIRKTISFQKVSKKTWAHGLEEGELDAGSFHKIALNSSNLFSQQRTFTRPDVAITLLVDLSGSMAGHKIRDARLLAIALTEALKDMPGVFLSVAGHTADRSRFSVGEEIIQEGSKVLYGEYYGKHHRNPYAISRMDAYANNYDGYAIECAARKIATDFPQAKRRIVIVISDGRPCNGMSHVRGCVETVKKRMGVDVYGIGVTNAYTYEDGIGMYGEGRSVVIGNTLDAISIISPFLKRVLSRNT